MEVENTCGGGVDMWRWVYMWRWGIHVDRGGVDM